MNVFNKDDVGKYYMDGNDILYRFIAYCECPSVTLEDVETKEKITFGVNGLCAREFVKLVKER